ncbi:hypothetical protein ACT009_17095 [Sphingomonas sp. Tas61C01]|uniref:hypothetical protein n=1 Tax=Sphingomonas sp. Tas61C01 TaxID=3458297 RepID=UPI00403E76D4
MRTALCLTASVCLATSPIDAQAHQHAPNETLGTVSFETSCSPAVAGRFDTAVALMHSFQFGRAIDGFNVILKDDPGCAIAYWGIAISIWGNPFAGFKTPAQLAQGAAAVRQARAVGGKTARERGYIDAVAQLYTEDPRLLQPARMQAYETAMAALASANPADTEATIFYALALAASADPGDKTYSRQLGAGVLLEGLFARFPDHPGLAHYIIHAYDEPALAGRAAKAAARYAAIAPSTPHALHMPSHTFTRVGDWQGSIAANRGSATAARAAGQPADVLHASDYLVYAYLQTGQDRLAADLVETSAAVFATFDPAHASGAAPPSAAFYAHAAIPARYDLERHAWADAARRDVVAGPFPNATAISYFARGVGAAHLRDEAGATRAIDALARLREQLIRSHDDYWAGQVEIQRQEVAALRAHARGDAAAAIAGLRAVALLEDSTELASVTPGPFLPARELLGELLLERNEPGEALAAFRASLVKEPNRFWSLHGAMQAAARSGDRSASRSYEKQLQGVTGSLSFRTIAAGRSGRTHEPAAH